MTEILPGIELDWLMAEQIMGWVREEGAWIRSDGRQMGHTYTWEPSIYIAHAWQVAKKLDLLIIGFDFRDGHVTCRMVSIKLGIAECVGETEAHAICLTALALMKEFNGQETNT